MKRMQNFLSFVVIVFFVVLMFLSQNMYALNMNATQLQYGGSDSGNNGVCSTKTTRIDSVSSRIEADFNNQIRVNKEHDSQIKYLIGEIKKLGFDTFKLETDWQTWSYMSTKIEEQKLQVLSDVESLKGMQCDYQQGQFRGLLDIIKTKISYAKSLQVGKNEYFSNTIKNDFLSLKNQINGSVEK